MIKFTNQQGLEIIENYYRNSESVVATLRALTPIFSRNNTGLQGFVVEKLWVVPGVIFDVESESGIGISLSRQDFEIFEVMCWKNGFFRYIWGYVQGARNFFGSFLRCHHLELLFPFKTSDLTVTSDFFSQRYGHIQFWHLSEQPYEHSHWLFGAYHSAFENLSWFWSSSLNLPSWKWKCQSCDLIFVISNSETPE